MPDDMPRLSLESLPADIRATVEEKFAGLPARLTWPREPREPFYAFLEEPGPEHGTMRIVVSVGYMPFTVVPTEEGGDAHGVDVTWRLEIIQSRNNGCWANAIPAFSGVRMIDDTDDDHFLNIAFKQAGFEEVVIHKFTLDA